MAVIRVLEAISAGFGVVWQRGETQDVSDDLARLLVTQRRAEYVSPPAAPADWLVPVMKKVDEAADQSSVSGGARTVIVPEPSPGALTTDVTTMLQNAINSTPEFGEMILANCEYPISGTLKITKHLSVRGRGSFATVGAWGDNGHFDSPGQAPWLGGTVLAQNAPATDCLQITGSAISVPLSDLGIRFDAGRFSNTGNGIVAKSDRAYGLGSEHGLFHSTWQNIHVFGHDGNHYAFKLTNFLHSQFNQLRSYGGGGIYLECDSYAGNYGNSVFSNPIMSIFCPGSAHGYVLKARTSGAASGVLNLLTFVRPQTVQSDATAKFGVSATASQYLFLAAVGGISPNAVSIIGPDFETTVGGLCDFGSGTKFIDPSGIFGKSTDTTSRNFTVMRSTFGSKVLNSDLRFKNINSPGPTIVTSGGAGTGATVSISGDDEGGTITLNTGTGAFAGGLFVVTMGRETAGVSAIALTPRNSAAAACNLYVQGKSATTWQCAPVTAPASSSTLIWDYRAFF